jgi:hypothetical protein
VDVEIKLGVDGSEHRLTVDTRTTLLDALRERLSITQPPRPAGDSRRRRGHPDRLEGLAAAKASGCHDDFVRQHPGERRRRRAIEAEGDCNGASHDSRGRTTADLVCRGDGPPPACPRRQAKFCHYERRLEQFLSVTASDQASSSCCEQGSPMVLIAG